MIPGLDEEKRQLFLKKVLAKSLELRKTLNYTVHSYDCPHQTDENKFEYFISKSKSFKTVIYIHGGVWRFSKLEGSAFLADFFTNAGCNFVPIGFNPATLAGVTNVVFEVRCALKEILRTFPDQTEVYIMGHSSGAHIALAALICDNFSIDYPFSEEERNRIIGLILISGTYDLRVMCRDGFNVDLNMDLDEAWKLSPLRCVDEIKKFKPILKIILLVEDNPSLHFIKHSKDLWENFKLYLNVTKTQFFIVKDTDHFTIVGRIGDEDYEITKLLLEFLSLEDSSNVYD